ncbi:hypothetical protein F4808DRAFT_100077 [Astrocystis sublimbata]|nr:hypothetical protein F4808DRAFT_100077 [Astrocystis sublimbata]
MEGGSPGRGHRRQQYPDENPNSPGRRYRHPNPDEPPITGHLPVRPHNHDSSSYPPLPGEDPRATAHYPRAQMAAGPLTLPSIHDRSEMYAPSARTWESRGPGYAPSPAATNGYLPPNGGPGPSYSPAATAGSPYPPPGGPHQPYPITPSPAHPHDGRNSFPPPPHHPHAQDHRHVYAPEPNVHDPRGGFASDPRGNRMINYPNQPHGPMVNGGGAYDHMYRNDGAPMAYAPEYARGQSAVIAHGQSAPRQRTSIACKYCRRRKIRCSGYATGGKCTNCLKMNQECVFQPVSSTSSTAFVPVSALAGGVPPGMQLFGAYGQPLAHATPGAFPPAMGNYQIAGSNPQLTPPHYNQPLPSPNGSTQSHWEETSDTSRRRHRTSEEHGVRLPPPSNFPDDNSRRRSPSSNSPNPVALYPASQPQPIPRTSLDDNITPPPRGSPAGAPVNASVMNIGNLMSSNSPSGPDNEIDRGMLGRLDRRRRQ